MWPRSSIEGISEDRQCFDCFSNYWTIFFLTLLLLFLTLHCFLVKIIFLLTTEICYKWKNLNMSLVVISKKYVFD